jgi:hypothetical protein
MEVGSLSRLAPGRAGRMFGSARARGVARWAAPALYVAALTAFMWREGVPVGRDRVLI